MKLQDVIFLLKADRFMIVTNSMTGAYVLAETNDKNCLAVLSKFSHREIDRIEPYKGFFKITLKDK